MPVIPGNNTESNSSISSVPSACAIQPASLSVKIGLTVAYLVIFLVGLLGNAMIIFLVNHYAELKTTFNMLIVNMAASDILDVMTAVPLSVAYLHYSVEWFSGGFGVFLCKFLPFLAFLSIGTSVLTLTVMTFDRYLAIVHTMRRPRSPKRTAVAIASTWIISGLVFATEFYKYQLFNVSDQVICASRWVEDLQQSHKVTMYEMIVRFVLLYLIPFLTMAILYSRIVLHLWKRKAPGEHIDKIDQRIERQNRKVIVMLITIVTIFAICWLPAHVNHFLATFDFNAFSCLPTSLILSLFFVTHANTAINPCLYVIFNESFRGAFKKQLRMRRRFRDRHSSLTVSNSTFKTGSRAVSGGGVLECHGLNMLKTDSTRESAV